mmetsp:Transcript_3271/g.7378  ORF Transcript_3271/g.7378 Transcript_3271/m.7378 type:complete len:284 (-) Transcript_3271:331-1182(-)
MNPTPFDFLVIFVFHFVVEHTHLLSLFNGQSINPTQSVALVDFAQFLELFHLLHPGHFSHVVFPADGKIEEGHEAEDHEHGIGASIGDCADDDVGMVGLDLFDGGNGVGVEVPFSGVVTFHFPRVIDCLDDAGMNCGAGPFLRRLPHRSSQILHIRGPVRRSLPQLSFQNKLLHLLPNGSQPNFLMIHRRGLQRIHRDGRSRFAIGGDLRANFFPGLDDFARLDSRVAEVGHGLREGGVGFVEDRLDGGERVVEVEGDEAEFFLFLLFVARRGGRGGGFVVGG